MTDFSALLGEDPAPISVKRRPGRPRKDAVDPLEVLRRRALERAAGSSKDNDLGTVLQGVSITALMKIFRKGRPEVVKALQDAKVAPVKTIGKQIGDLYDLAEAAAALVPSNRDRDTFFRNIKADDLPQHLQERFWDAKLKEMRFRRLAGDLWSTTQVMDALSRVFKTIKDHTIHWADQTEARGNLTPEQHAVLTGLVDEMLDELLGTLREQSAKSATGSYAQRFASDSENDSDI